MPDRRTAFAIAQDFPITAGRLVERTARRLAVDGRVLANLFADLVEPLCDTSDELGPIQPVKHAAERVVRRDAVFEPKRRSQSSESPVAESRGVRPRIGPDDRAAERYHDEVEHIVQARPGDTPIGKTFERRVNRDTTLRPDLLSFNALETLRKDPI